MGQFCDSFGKTVKKTKSVKKWMRNLYKIPNHRHRSWYSEGDIPVSFLKVLLK